MRKTDVMKIGDTFWLIPVIATLIGLLFLILAQNSYSISNLDSDSAFRVTSAIIGLSAVLFTYMSILEKRISTTQSNRPIITPKESGRFVGEDTGGISFTNTGNSVAKDVEIDVKYQQDGDDKKKGLSTPHLPVGESLKFNGRSKVVNIDAEYQDIYGNEFKQSQEIRVENLVYDRQEHMERLHRELKKSVEKLISYLPLIQILIRNLNDMHNLSYHLSI